jgi:hypothetical protein
MSSSSSSAYVPTIYSGGLLVGGFGGLGLGIALANGFWAQYASDSSGSVAPYLIQTFLGIGANSDCVDCDYCLCPQCETCLPNTSPVYVTATLSGWVTDLDDVRIVGTVDGTYDLGLMGAYLQGQISSSSVSQAVAGAGANQCYFSRSWQCNKPFIVQVNPGLTTSGSAIPGTPDGWVNVFETSDDGNTLTLEVDFGLVIINSLNPADGVPTLSTEPVFLPAISVRWTIDYGDYPIILGQGVYVYGTGGSFGALVGDYLAGNYSAYFTQGSGCNRCKTTGCVDGANGFGRIDCTQTYELATTLTGLDEATPGTMDGVGVELQDGSQTAEFYPGGIFTQGATTVTGNASPPTTWFPITDNCPGSTSAPYSVSTGTTSSSYSNSYGSTIYSSGSTVVIVPGGGAGGGGGGGDGPGPGPGGGPSTSDASSGCICEADCPGSLQTLSCVDGTTAGPLVPCYNSGLAGKVFEYTDGNCYTVTAIKNSAAATYSPTQTYTDCTDCNNADLFIQCFPCTGEGGGDVTWWTYVPGWVASGYSVILDGGVCYLVSAGNTKVKFDDLPSNAVILDAPTLTDCSSSPCPTTPNQCTDAPNSPTYTLTATWGTTCTSDTYVAGQVYTFMLTYVADSACEWTSSDGQFTLNCNYSGAAPGTLVVAGGSSTGPPTTLTGSYGDLPCWVNITIS